jgi:hypothetical protein
MEETGRSREQESQAVERRTAYDYRDRLRAVTGWSDDDLRDLPIWQGEQFGDGEVYFNLNLPERGPFRGTPQDRPLKGYLYVAKGEVPDAVWLRLIDGWGTDLPMGSGAAHPGAFGWQGEGTRVGYGSTGSEDAGGTPTEKVKGS